MGEQKHLGELIWMRFKSKCWIRCLPHFLWKQFEYSASVLGSTAGKKRESSIYEHGMAIASNFQAKNI